MKGSQRERKNLLLRFTRIFPVKGNDCLFFQNKSLLVQVNVWCATGTYCTKSVVDVCYSVSFTVFIELKEKNVRLKLVEITLKGCIFDKTTTFQRFFFSQFCPKWICVLKKKLDFKKCTWLSREDGGRLPLLLVDEEGGPSSKMAVTSVPASAAEWWQVWSLTQFHSVDFSQSRISVKKSIF